MPVRVAAWSSRISILGAIIALYWGRLEEGAPLRESVHVPAADFATYPSASNRAPAVASAALTTVRKSILLLGEIRRISKAACIPFITSMLMSSKTRSGFKALTFSMASFLSLASPQTCNPCHPSSPRIVVRASG